MSKITWLHLSDFHFKNNHDIDGNVNEYYRNKVLEPLLDDIDKYPKKLKLKIDFILITGDLAFSGKKDEYEHVAKFLDMLLEKFDNLSKKNIFLVPGNHDINRDNIKNINCTFKTLEEITRLFFDEAAINLQLRRFEDYRSFITNYFSGNLDFDYKSKFFWVKTFKPEWYSIPINILGLNSAWNCSTDKEAGEIIIGEKQMGAANL